MEMSEIKKLNRPVILMTTNIPFQLTAVESSAYMSITGLDDSDSDVIRLRETDKHGVVWWSLVAECGSDLVHQFCCGYAAAIRQAYGSGLIKS